jgi:tetratricopeptide (TPR) repeat protein
MAYMPRSDDFARLESEVEKNPASERARERLLEALSADPERFDDPRRFELIAWFLQHNPRHHICVTPFMYVNPETAPGAFRDLKARWLALVSRDPADPLLARGAAALLATESLEEGKRLLRAAIAQRPADPELWLDLGRMSEDPGERLKALEKALDAGETRPNLLVWIATTSFEAGDYEKAERTAGELIELVDEARTRFSDKLDWPERGSELWERARNACASDVAAARELVDAHSQHAYRKHWAHTVLGLLACRIDDLDRAVSHLRASADVRPEYRLSSYGPSLDLVREVCARGRWEEGLDFLRVWEAAWDHPRLGQWIAAVKERRLPETDGSA